MRHSVSTSGIAYNTVALLLIFVGTRYLAQQALWQKPVEKIIAGVRAKA
jgi:hypothetical protein